MLASLCNRGAWFNVYEFGGSCDFSDFNGFCDFGDFCDFSDAGDVLRFLSCRRFPLR